MSDLREVRIGKHLTQQEAADLIGISLRSYISYEKDEDKKKNPKYRFFLQELEQSNPIDEEHGVLSLDEITKICGEILADYKVEYCYLFGSYAKGKATGSSDVDLLISSKITGLKFYELKLKEDLAFIVNHMKNVDKEELSNFMIIHLMPRSELR